MKYYGITDIQIKIFTYINDVNEFLKLHNGNILDIISNSNDITIVYKEIDRC